MYSSNLTLKSHTVRLMQRLTAIALFAGTLYTSMAGVAFAQYNPPADLGLPSRREPGGTRGTCLGSSASPADGLSLTPLMPTEQEGNAYFGQTLSPYPTFYWYVPAITASAAEFVLMDDNDNEIYTAKFQLAQTEQGGLISLSLPENAGFSPLEINKTYRWYFSLICDEFDRGTDVYTEGWVQRIPSDALPALETLPNLSQSEQSYAYAQAGIWFEALEIVAEDQRLTSAASSGQINPGWEELLEDVGLEAFTTADFLN